MSEEILEEVSTETLYVGSKKVANYSVQENANLVGVLYEDETSDNFTLDQWEAVKSNEPYQDSDIPYKKFEGLMKMIIGLMVENRVSIIERGWILERVDESLHQNYQKSIRKLFGVKKEGEILLATIDEILRK